MEHKEKKEGGDKTKKRKAREREEGIESDRYIKRQRKRERGKDGEGDITVTTMDLNSHRRS